MKKLTVLLFIVGFVAVMLNSCKKCYTCTNTCTQCAITINNHTFTNQYCRDSFDTDNAYQAAVSHDTANGYTCASAPSTYKYDFCVNKPGDEQYQNYFNQGKKSTCNEK